MPAQRKCESCGMPVASGVYCGHCTDESGRLQDFEERLKRLAEWMVVQKRAPTRAAAEQQALAYMATMPAWRAHPKLLARTKRKG